MKKPLFYIGAVLVGGILIGTASSGLGGLSQNDQIACIKFETIEKNHVWASVAAGFNQAEGWKLRQDYSDDLLNLASSEISSELKGALIDDALSNKAWIPGSPLSELTSKFCDTDPYGHKD